MKTEEIPGEVKRCVALKSFVFQGEQILEGQDLELNSDDYLEIERKCLNPFTPIVSLIEGGRFRIERCSDGFHRISPWAWPGKPFGFNESDPFVRVEFLQDCPSFLVKKGDKRRLRLSIVREFPHRFLDSPPASPYLAVRAQDTLILIHEKRPRRISDEEIAERQAAVAFGMEQAARGSWTLGTSKQFSTATS
jgi:hypothetical protein